MFSFLSMRNLLPFALALVVLCSCSKYESDDNVYGDSYNNVFSEDGETIFREIILDISPYIIHNDTVKYILCDSLSNVTLTVNKNDWGTANSYVIDSATFSNKELVGNYIVTKTPIKYSTRVIYRSDKESLTTAGDYADMLNNLWALEPGFYICQLPSFELHNSGGNKITVKTSISEVFEVKEGTKNSYIGTHKILINN